MHRAVVLTAACLMLVSSRATDGGPITPIVELQSEPRTGRMKSWT